MRNWCHLGVAYSMQGKWTKAEMTFKKGLDAFPGKFGKISIFISIDDSSLRVNYILMLLRNGKLKQAKDAFEQVDFHPHMSWIRNYFAKEGNCIQ